MFGSGVADRSSTAGAFVLLLVGDRVHACPCSPAAPARREREQLQLFGGRERAYATPRLTHGSS